MATQPAVTASRWGREPNPERSLSQSEGMLQFLGLMIDTSPLFKPRRRQSAMRTASSFFAVSRSLMLKCVDGRFALAIESSIIGSFKHGSITPLRGPDTPTIQRSDVPEVMSASPGFTAQLPRARGRTLIPMIHWYFPLLGLPGARSMARAYSRRSKDPRGKAISSYRARAIYSTFAGRC